MKLGVNIDPYLKGIVILVISIGANFIGDTLSCKTRDLLNNMYMKHIFSFALLYTTIDLSKGDIIIFPSNFMYPHKVEPVTKGIRYSYISWIW